MVKVHGQKTKKEKKLQEPENLELQKEVEIISSKEIKIRMIIYDALLDSSHLQALGLPGDIFDYICDKIVLNILHGLKNAGFNILDNEEQQLSQQNFINLIKDLEEKVIDPEATIKNEFNKRQEYLLSVINQLIIELEPINEMDFNCFIPFKRKSSKKLKDEEPSIVIAYNPETNQEGISTFSLISTITNLLINKKILFESDEETDLIISAQWDSIKKSIEIEKKLEQAIINWKNAPSNKKAALIEQLIDVAKLGIIRLKEQEG